ncbi:MAG: acetyl-CoA carboxylase biotin carboxyl carrier protein [Hyphomonadaceae bacterium]
MAEKNGKIDTGLIRELASILRDGGLGEIEVEHGDLRVRVSMPEPAAVNMSAPVAMAPAAAPVAPAAPAAAAPAPAPPASLDSHPGAVKSPMVGTAYLSPDPESPLFVNEGDTVAAGQTLLLVEAMKTFNPVTAPKAGKLVRLVVGNEQPVEFGEVLAIIE